MCRTTQDDRILFKSLLLNVRRSAGPREREQVLRRALTQAGLPALPAPLPPPYLRQSVARGRDVAGPYVQEQLGHASIELTVGTDGRWLRKRAPGAVDRLDQAPGGLAETAAVGGHADVPADGPARPLNEQPSSRLVADTPSQVSKARPRQRKLLIGVVTRHGLEP